MPSLNRSLSATSVAVALALATACSATTNGTGANTKPTPATGASASTSGTAAATSAATSGGTPTASTPASSTHAVPHSSARPGPGTSGCTGAQLRITGHYDNGGSAAGHQRAILVFTNISATTCTLFGYPGVDGIPPHPGPGVIQHFARSLRGMLGGLPSGSDTKPTLTLGHGTAVHAVIEASSVPNSASNDCTPFQNLKVTAPNTTITVTLPINSLPSCTPQVHPVQAGASG
ncbi:MAG: hypothetical protein QOF92_1907 [Pseudonocardiales bacterium]|nr:hypothetical protein [Pseudonocardiales bacterium]